MTRPAQGEVTLLLHQARQGDEDARGRLIELVYAELHALAAGLMRRETVDHTLQPTALLNEAFLRMFRGDALEKAPDRAYFFGAAARAMRQVLVDHARRRDADKRGGDRERVPLDDVLDLFERQHFKVLDLEGALERLAALNERHSQVVTLRYFGGLTMPEIAGQLGVSVSTVEKDLPLALAFLRRQLA